jgi:hypothetical protein
MTSDTRRTIKERIDAAVRARLEAGEEIPGDLVMDEELPDNEETRRAYLIWKAQPWRLFTRCSSHGEMAHCGGPTRDSVVCLRCYIAGPTRSRRKTMNATTTTATVSLRGPFVAKIRENLDGVEIIEKVAYDRVVRGKKTLAYVNGDRKLKIDVPKVEGSGVDGFKIAAEDEFGPALDAIGALDAALLAKVTAATAPVEEVEPDPKPEPKKRSRSRKAPAKA